MAEAPTSLLKFVSVNAPVATVPGQILWLRVPAAAKAILGFVAGKSCVDGFGRPASGFYPVSMGEFCDFLGISDRMVQIHLEQLDRDGYLERLVGGGRKQPSLYRLRWWAVGEQHAFFAGFNPGTDAEGARLPLSLLLDVIPGLEPELRVAWWQLVAQTQGRTGFAAPNLALLAAQMGITTRTARLRIAALVQRGLLEFDPFAEGVRLPWAESAPGLPQNETEDLVVVLNHRAEQELGAKNPPNQEKTGTETPAPNFGVSAKIAAPNFGVSFGVSPSLPVLGPVVPSEPTQKGSRSSAESAIGGSNKQNRGQSGGDVTGASPQGAKTPAPNFGVSPKNAAPNFGVSPKKDTLDTNLGPEELIEFRSRGWLREGAPVPNKEVLALVHQAFPGLQPDPAVGSGGEGRGAYSHRITEGQALEIERITPWSLDGLRTLLSIFAGADQRGELRRPPLALFFSAAKNPMMGITWLERVCGRPSARRKMEAPARSSPQEALGSLRESWRSAQMAAAKQPEAASFRRAEAEAFNRLVDASALCLGEEVLRGIDQEVLADPALERLTAGGAAHQRVLQKLRGAKILDAAGALPTFAPRS